MGDLIIYNSFLFSKSKNVQKVLRLFAIISLTITILASTFGILYATSDKLPNSFDIMPTDDPLPSWKNTPIKNTIISFVKNVSDNNNSQYFVPVNERIAVFDNDGTLWSEKPIYFEGFFAFERVPAVVKANPELADKSPFKQILAKNYTGLRNMTLTDILDLVTTTHGNITQTDFNYLVKEWAATARHPETGMRYIDMIYQPMLELMRFLEFNGFKNFIVSGGGIDFMRNALSSVYDIPPEKIIGSFPNYTFINNVSNDPLFVRSHNKSFLVREPIIISINNEYEKPVNIQLFTGQIPILAAGNSDGDLQMMEYVADSNKPGKSLNLLIHHDDALREFSYDKGAEEALLEFQDRGWNIVSMENDFAYVYPSDKNVTNVH